MRRIATSLVVTAVGIVVIAGVVDAVRGSHSESGRASASTIEPLSTTGGSVRTTARDGATTTQDVSATAPAVGPVAPERLPSCGTRQLALTFTVWDGLAALVLRRVAGKPCHHGRTPIGLTVRDQSGHKVPLFRAPAERRSTVPADFSDGFAQLMQIPYEEVCDPAGSFLAVAKVGPYAARRTFEGKYLVCDHG